MSVVRCLTHLRRASSLPAVSTTESCHPDYDTVAQQIKANGDTTLELRRALATKVYLRTAEYDAMQIVDDIIQV